MTRGYLSKAETENYTATNHDERLLRPAETAVSREFLRLESLLQNLSKTKEGLKIKLSPILTPIEEIPDGDKPVEISDREDQSLVANRIARSANELSKLIDQFHGIIDRIEI